MKHPRWFNANTSRCAKVAFRRSCSGIQWSWDPSAWSRYWRQRRLQNSTTGAKTWRGGKGCKDLVWVNIKTTNVVSPGRRVASLQDKLPSYLNALFTMRTPSGCVLKLAHVTLLQAMGKLTPNGPEGMYNVQNVPGSDWIVWLKSLEGAVHLIPLEPSGKWIVNNRIDHHTWNEVHDCL